MADRTRFEERQQAEEGPGGERGQQKQGGAPEHGREASAAGVAGAANRAATGRPLPRRRPVPPARAPAARLRTETMTNFPKTSATRVSTSRRHQWAMAGQARLARASGRKSTAT